MAEKSKSDTGRAEAVFIFAIGLGLVLGFLIKRIKIGIIIGIVLGLLIVLTGMLRSKSR